MGLPVRGGRAVASGSRPPRQVGAGSLAGSEALSDKDPRTGQPETRYPGVDRGWEYNVGKASLDGLVPVELQGPLPPAPAPADPNDPAPARPGPADSLPPLPAPQPADPARLLPDGLPDDDYVTAFLKAFDAVDRPAYFRDASGGVIVVDRSMFVDRTAGPVAPGEQPVLKVNKYARSGYVALLADAVKDPDEIWVDWAETASGPVLRRSYLKRVLLPQGQSLFVRFQATKAGWLGVTAFQTQERYIRKFRVGALLWRRK